MMEAIIAVFPSIGTDSCQMFCTGSGAGPLAGPTGAKFVQEVNAVTLAFTFVHAALSKASVWTSRFAMAGLAWYPPARHG